MGSDHPRRPVQTHMPSAKHRILIRHHLGSIQFPWLLVRLVRLTARTPENEANSMMGRWNVKKSQASKGQANGFRWKPRPLGSLPLVASSGPTIVVYARE
ncbi:hypothetical protein AG1IA_01585 [Rhizoctonia solani AG-1 IA]|uniref:Uncharacterized protein n=1 Tax=Thanatephorus cucumeris (strain AG1-IA) TaxID=983506 RepID=L8X5S2_THACA|nr:hypothetical protein AG1IA_01585 [Rhizoctonia solani AG-1 IA]